MDEASFFRNAIMNFNNHVWSEDNPGALIDNYFQELELSMTISLDPISFHLDLTGNNTKGF